MSKKILIVLFAIVLFIPSFVAIGYYSSTKKEPNDTKDVTNLVIEDIDGTKWTLSSEDEGNESKTMIDMFINMRNDAVSIAALPDAMSGTSFFKVTLTSFETESIYQYYFTDIPSAAYIVDSAGLVYKIAEDDAASFLATKYSISVYGNNSVPVLVVAGSNISPSAAAWNYSIYDGTFQPLDTTEIVTSEVKSCRISGGLSLGFTETPDYAKVVIKCGEETIFDDLMENMDQLSLTDISDFNVTITAEWYQSSTKSYYGTASYSFIGDVIEPAVFYLGQTEVENGKFVCISGKNVEDASQIQFASEPSIDYTPTFFAEGEYVYALVPIRYELEDGKTQNYTFTITYGGVPQTMNLTVTPYTYKASSSAISKAVEEATYNAEARAEAESVLKDIANKEVLDARAFSGTFLEDVVGPNSTDKISPGFGRKITVTATKTEFQHTGCDYNVPEGTEVYAVNNGTVVYSGYLTTTGYIVVVDHGWGLKSWYCHMSKNSVEVGAEVKRGDVVGLSGDTGFTYTNRTHVGLTVFDVPVCIYKLWNEPLAVAVMN